MTKPVPVNAERLGRSPVSRADALPTEDAESDFAGHDLSPARDLADYIREYARQKPDVAALWCFGVGIIVGWKIKPW